MYVLASGHMLDQLIVTNNFSLKILEKKQKENEPKSYRGQCSRYINDIEYKA